MSMPSPLIATPSSPSSARQAQSPARRRLTLLVLVVGVGLLAERAVSWVSEAEPIAQPRARGDRPAHTVSARSGADTQESSTPAAPADLRLDLLQARETSLGMDPDARADLAAAQALFAANKPAAAAQAASAPPAPPPRPVAPPFPYSYVGGLLDETGRTLYFGLGDRLVTLRAGATVDGVYRVERISDSAIQLMYLPLSQPMTIPFGGPR